jgi:hypothetical protein
MIRWSRNSLIELINTKYILCIKSIYRFEAGKRYIIHPYEYSSLYEYQRYICILTEDNSSWHFHKLPILTRVDMLPPAVVYFNIKQVQLPLPNDDYMEQTDTI